MQFNIEGISSWRIEIYDILADRTFFTDWLEDFEDLSETYRVLSKPSMFGNKFQYIISITIH